VTHQSHRCTRATPAHGRTIKLVAIVVAASTSDKPINIPIVGIGIEIGTLEEVRHAR
jgi:hypothetical protein